MWWWVYVFCVLLFCGFWWLDCWFDCWMVVDWLVGWVVLLGELVVWWWCCWCVWVWSFLVLLRCRFFVLLLCWIYWRLVVDCWVCLVDGSCIWWVFFCVCGCCWICCGFVELFGGFCWWLVGSFWEGSWVLLVVFCLWYGLRDGVNSFWYCCMSLFCVVFWGWSGCVVWVVVVWVGGFVGVVFGGVCWVWFWLLRLFFLCVFLVLCSGCLDKLGFEGVFWGFCLLVFWSVLCVWFCCWRIWCECFGCCMMVEFWGCCCVSGMSCERDWVVCVCIVCLLGFELLCWCWFCCLFWRSVVCCRIGLVSWGCRCRRLMWWLVCCGVWRVRLLCVDEGVWFCCWCLFFFWCMYCFVVCMF